MLKQNLFKFPTSLKNDVEGFIHFYPKKFPRVKEKYLQVLKQYYNDPEGLRELCLKESREMIRLTKKFVDKNKDFKAKKGTTHLIKLDQKMHKLSCFKFWIYNYLLCEGDLQTYHTEIIKTLANKIAQGESLEEIEEEKELIIKTLIQSDYTDLYVENMLASKHIFSLLKEQTTLQEILKKLKETKERAKINNLLEQLMGMISNNPKMQHIYEELKWSYERKETMGNQMMFFSQIMTYIKFKEKVDSFEKKQEKIKLKIKQIFNQAKRTLINEEYLQLKKSYKMTRLLAECKDLFGDSDDFSLPFWFALINEIAKRINSPYPELGQGASFYNFIWCAPTELQNYIYTPDKTGFNEQELFNL